MKRQIMRLRFKRLIVLGMVLCVTTVSAEDITNTITSGPVTVTTTLSPTDLTIGDEVALRIEILAEKDVEVFPLEFDEVVSGFRVAEWIPISKINSDGSVNQTVTYKFQLSSSGRKSISPILIEFVDNRPGKPKSPDDFDAFEIETELIDFEVKSVAPSGATNEMRPPLGTLELPSRRLANKWWVWLVGCVGLVTLVAAIVLWRSRSRCAKKANAYELAHIRLQRILDDRKSPSPMLSIEQFFVEISGIIRRYLEDRFELRAPELTTDEFLQLAAKESDLSREHQQLLSEFLQQADAVKFAGVQATNEDVTRSSDLAARFLEETRSNAPEVEVADDLHSLSHRGLGDRAQVASRSGEEESADV